MMSQYLSEHDTNLRLKLARERAGYDTAADFARAHGIKPTTYYHHENGRRELKPRIAKTYARLLKVPVSVLLFGEALHELHNVPIVGTVNGTGKIEALTGSHQINEFATLPDHTVLEAHRVFGDELYPVYRDGDIVLHRRLSTDRYDPDVLLGVECVVELENGDRLLRQITPQSDGRVTLYAYHTPPMINQVVVAAAPVEIVQRALPHRLNNH